MLNFENNNEIGIINIITIKLIFTVKSTPLI